MGREVRRVPQNWEHPETMRHYGRMGPQPMRDQTFEAAATEWLADFDRIRNGGAVGYEIECYPGGAVEWAAENPPPDPMYHRPWRDDEATWFQVWETVSEGTPVSPPFETEGELIDYLARNGDFWDQKRCHEPDWSRLWGGVPGVSAWGRERAEAFVKSAWAPSMILMDGQLMDGTAAVQKLRERG